MNYKKKNNSGFTIIELLIVIAIISILSAVFFVASRNIRDKARVAKAQAEMKQMINAIYTYKDLCGKFPPGRKAGYQASCPLPDPHDGLRGMSTVVVDPCQQSGGFGGTNSWQVVMDDLVALNLIPRINLDPWGEQYCYDDNDGYQVGNNNTVTSPSDPNYYTVLFSMGPNRRRGTFNWGSAPGPAKIGGVTCGGANDNCRDNFGFLIPDD